MLFQENKFLFALSVILICFLALLAFIFFVIFRNIKIRQQKEVEIRDAIIKTQSAEQNRIADDLHDELAPMLSAIKLQLNNLDGLSAANQSSIDLCTERLNRSIEELRLISRNLSDKMISNNGLIPSIEDSINLFSRHSKIKFETEFSVIENELTDSEKNNIYKILMELIHNSIKHSNGNKISISLLQKSQDITIKYSDNGTSENANKGKGIGTSTIANRISLMHGKIISQNQNYLNGAHYEFEIPGKGDQYKTKEN